MFTLTLPSLSTLSLGQVMGEAREREDPGLPI